MSDPLTGTGSAAGALAGVTFVGIFSGADAGVVIAAFAGAVVFVLSAVEFPAWKRIAFGFVSFMMGVIAAGFTASIIDWFLPDQVVVDKPIGALVASACVIWVLMFIISKAKNPPPLNFKGGGK
ncbi:phage holin family protein [Edwardsiella piscicida]|uniref:phage holin family protein n=1 Tax=Edwardsiella piscicida TaxID=1263550 RepID=UPI00370D5E4E